VRLLDQQVQLVDQLVEAALEEAAVEEVLVRARQ
jgi:hypothetical protein